MTFQEVVQGVNDSRKARRLEKLRDEVVEALRVKRVTRRAYRKAKEALVVLEEKYNKLSN